MDNNSDLRQQRNISVLQLKNQNIKTRYASGKVRIDVPGTEAEMTSNTILAIPAALLSKEGVTPAKSIRIDKYTQAGSKGKRVGSTLVGLQNNMVDLDAALDYTLKTDGGKLAPIKSKRKSSKVVVEDYDIVPEKLQQNNDEFGVAVKRPDKKKKLSPLTPELVDFAKSLLS